MLSLRKELQVPDSITTLKINRTDEGQCLVVEGPWGSADLSIQHPMMLERGRGFKRTRARSVSLQSNEGPRGHQSFASPAELDPLGKVQLATAYMDGHARIRRTKQMFGALFALVEDSLKYCAMGSHFGLFIKGLGWRASVRTGKEVPGGDEVPMPVEKPGRPRVVPYLPPGLKVAEDDQFLELKIGNSHYTHFHLKKGWRVTVDDYKGQGFVVSGGFDKASVGQFAARIRQTRTTEPYKGKGIRFVGESTLRKEGKKTQ
jgi:ribosomal protein L6P/L9E